MAKEAKKPETDESRMQQARSAAVSRLREENRDRYNAILQEEAAARGLTWKPKPSSKEKARAKIEALLAENPDLRDELVTVASA